MNSGFGYKKKKELNWQGSRRWLEKENVTLGQITLSACLCFLLNYSPEGVPITHVKKASAPDICKCSINGESLHVSFKIDKVLTNPNWSKKTNPTTFTSLSSQARKPSSHLTRFQSPPQRIWQPLQRSPAPSEPLLPQAAFLLREPEDQPPGNLISNLTVSPWGYENNSYPSEQTPFKYLELLSSRSSLLQAEPA